MKSFIFRIKNDIALVLFLSVIMLFSSIIIEYLYGMYLKDMEKSNCVSDNVVVLSVNAEKDQIIDMSFLQDEKYKNVSVFASNNSLGLLTYDMFLCNYVDFDISEGRCFSENDFKNADNVAIAGGDISNLDVNDTVTNQADYKIVGIFKVAKKQNVDFAKSDNLKIYFCSNKMKLYGAEETELFVKSENKEKALEFANEIVSALAPEQLNIYQKNNATLVSNFIESRKFAVSLSLCFFIIVLFAEIFAVMLWVLSHKRMIMVYNLLGKRFAFLSIFIKGMLLNIIAISVCFAFIFIKKLNIIFVSKWILALYLLLFIFCFAISILFINTSFVKKASDRENDE